MLKLSTIRTMLYFYSDDRKRLFVYIRSPVVSLDQKVLEQSLLNSECETSLITYQWITQHYIFCKRSYNF